MTRSFWKPEIARSLLQDIIAGDPNTLPAIDIVPAAELEGASGAFGLDDIAFPIKVRYT